MTSRNYIDAIISYLDSEVTELRNNNEPLTRAFFDNTELAKNAKEAVIAISKVYRWPAPSEDQLKQYFDTALTEFRSNNATDIIPSLSLRKTYEPSWLNEKRIEATNWHYTDRYFRFLKDNGRSEKIIAETKRSSLEILKKIGDPKSDKEFFIKGLVVGSVQSGKTANFNAVINGAIDLDYTLIIVLSGIMEDLRSQTQLRIEDDVVGYGVIDLEKENLGFKGVGDVRKFGELGDNTIKQILIPTSHKADFNKNVKAAEFPLNYKNILVCKKNTNVLGNLLLWLADFLGENQEQHDIPFLLVDDEADNASLNNMGAKGREYATKINGHIRAMLGLFKRKTYIGYTATPFANVLQDRNQAPESKWPVNTRINGAPAVKEFTLVGNLSPDDFIELLFPPSVYIGAKHFFETRMDEIEKIEPLIAPAISDYNEAFPARVSKVTGEPADFLDDDTRAAKKDDPYPQFLPESLKEAIQCFVIATAVRLSRRSEMIHSKLYQPHNTMLIHVSRFTNWQNTTKELVKEFFDDLTVRLNTELPNSPGSVYQEFERTWYKYFAEVIKNIKTYLPADYEDDYLTPKDFTTDIKPLLLSAANGTQIVALNSNSDDIISYPKKTEKKYIAIGGNRLSRGFTLEGLTINYFLRDTSFADTLLQMGRWFGYRPGYLDCCKLFTTQENIHKFDAVTVTIEELEEVFKDINRKNGKPSDFEIRVKNHPKVIRLTRDAILKNAEDHRVSFSLGIEQSTKFILDAQKFANSWSDLQHQIRSHTWNDDKNSEIFTTETDIAGLFKFLEIRNAFFDFDLSGVKEYINLCAEQGKLTKWTIGIRKNENSDVKSVLKKEVSGLPSDVNLTIRRGPKEKTNAWYDLLNRGIFKVSGKSAQIVTVGSDFSLTLSEAEIEKVKSDFIARVDKSKSRSSIPDKDYRSMMSEEDGILMIYLVDTKRIFESERDVVDTDLMNKAKQLNMDFNIPLVGFALGFPEINGDIGGDYMRFKTPEDLEAEKNAPEEQEDEFDEALNQL